MVSTCKKKGLNILGTGDVLQPEWLKYLESKLNKTSDGAYSYKDVFFILQSEIEDQESIHEVVLFPDFAAVKEAQVKLKPHSKNLLDEWGGRPRVNLSPAELVEKITDLGAVIGPAHAFTPFKAIFRQGKFKTLEDCYQGATKKISFLELGLSANTDLADRLASLKNVSFLSNSDAHSESPRSLGREFNRMEMDNASFEEILLALHRKDNRRITLNVGLHPKLGKYFNMFCNKCRRRVLFKSGKDASDIFNRETLSENFIIYQSSDPSKARTDYIHMVDKQKAICPACKQETKKNYKIKLGVSERIDVISTYKEPNHPNHRPDYVNAIPLIDIIRSVKKIKSPNSKTVLNLYNQAIDTLGSEFELLVDTPIENIFKFNNEIANVIEAFRNDEVKYTPGGGGTYGELKLAV
jgi:PHP family Zn ribbon phosphoesterase